MMLSQCDSCKMSYVLTVAIILILYLCKCHGVATRKFTNVQCNNLDENFSQFIICRMRAVKRDVTELSIRAKILEEPPANLTMRWQLMKKASGYKPFLYDVTVDVCEYLEKHNHPFINIIFNSFGNYSSIPEKCPMSINEEVYLLNFTFPYKTLEVMPLFAGEYAVFVTFGANGVERADVKSYFSLTDY